VHLCPAAHSTHAGATMHASTVMTSYSMRDSEVLILLVLYWADCGLPLLIKISCHAIVMPCENHGKLHVRCDEMHPQATMSRTSEKIRYLLSANIDLSVPLASLLEEGDTPVVGGLSATLPSPASEHGHQLRLRHLCRCRQKISTLLLCCILPLIKCEPELPKVWCFRRCQILKISSRPSSCSCR